MDIDDLQVIEALSRFPTFSTAGRALGIAHTTVSRKVAALEKHFGARLIERVGETVALTAEGEKALATAQRIQDEFFLLERDITGRDGRLVGRISLTTVDILAWRYMDRFREFTARYPEIDLTLSVDSEVRSLSRRESEVAIRLTNAPEEHLFGHVIDRLEFAPYVRTDMDDDPAALPWIGYNAVDCAARAAKAIKALAPATAIRSHVPTPLMMHKAVQSGMGAGILPIAIAGDDPTLKRIGDSVSFELDVWILTPKELRHTARIRALFALFKG